MSWIRSISRISYEVNRAYCNAIGDVTVPAGPPWTEADPEAQRRYYTGVKRHLETPDSTPEQDHEAWMRAHDGWTYGPVKDSNLREHPCMVSWAELPEQQRFKARLCKTVCALVVNQLAVQESEPHKPTFYSSRAERVQLAYNVTQDLSVEEWIEGELEERLELLATLAQSMEQPPEGQEAPSAPALEGATQEWIDLFKIVYTGMMNAHGIS